MFNLSVPWWEFIVRGGAVYFFLLIFLRITGKRQVGQLAPFDLVLLLVLSNAVQNSMNAGDNSLIGGLISASTLILLNFLLANLTFRNRKVEALVDGQPQILIHDGRLIENVIAKALLTHHELRAALRAAGCTEVDEVKLAVLETTGAITVIPKVR